MRVNHVRDCTQDRELSAKLQSDPPLLRRAKKPQEREEEPERASGNDPVELVLRRRGPTPTGDAFTYLTCNNLEKVLTMARGSPRFERKTRNERHGDETEGSGVGREHSADEPSQRMT